MIIEYLTEFIYLAREKSLTSAAKKLYLSQPTLSKHIVALEKEFGVRLFERDSHGIKLTPEGSIAAQLFEVVVNDYEQAVNALSLSKKGYTRTLTFAFLDHLLDAELYEKTERIKAIRPDFLINVVFKNAAALSEGLHDGTIDVALQMNYRYRNDESVSMHFLKKHPLSIAVKDNDPLCGLDHVTLKDLEKRNLVMPSDSMGFSQCLNEWFDEHNLSRPSIVHSTQRSTQLLTALQEKSVAIVLAELPRNIPSGMKCLTVDEQGLAVGFYWICHKSSEDKELLNFLDRASKIFLQDYPDKK